MHESLLKKVEQAKEISEASPYNKVVSEAQNKELGVISSSSAYNYAAEAVDFLGLDASVLKLGMTHPFPEKKIGNFLKNHEKIIVVEELEPFLEMQVKVAAKDYAPNVEIYGKMNMPYFSRKGELSTRLVIRGLSEITNKKLPIDLRKTDERYAEIAKDLPSRPPVMCAGCPHRASFHVIKKVTAGKAIYPTDIGCYALGIAPPLRIGDILICMGASVSTAQGISKVTDLDTIPVIGDSTFFHAAIPGLVNAVYNNHKITLVVLDNLTTAMTGNQPHPGTGVTGMKALSQKVLIEKVAEGCGVKYVRVVNPFKIKEAATVLKEALQQHGPSVVVFRAPCALMVARERRRKGARIAPCKVTDECTDCLACIKLLGCPALVVKHEKVRIDEAVCNTCGLCISVCPYNAIRCGESD